MFDQDHYDADYADRYREYLERYWHIECAGCHRKEFTTQATAELVGWCLGKTSLCERCDEQVKSELAGAITI